METVFIENLIEEGKKVNDLNLDEERNDILGELDSLNSFIGLAKSFVKEKKVRTLLTDIQNDIFVIQANTASPENALSKPQNITFGRILSLQKETFLIERRLKKINHFIIPEGAPAACFMHCVRTMARQIERKIPGYLKEPTPLAMYLDRVAGLMFALARFINMRAGVRERPPAYTKRDLQKKEGEGYGRKRRKGSQEDTRANSQTHSRTGKKTKSGRRGRTQRKSKPRKSGTNISKLA